MHIEETAASPNWKNLDPEAQKDLYKRAKTQYYEDPDGKNLMSDAAFDALEDHLREQFPKWSGFKAGAKIVGKKTKVKLPIPMFSLTKTKTAEGVDSFVSEGHDITIMDKLDGSSLELVYEKGVPTQLITRGNGKIGGDVSFLIPHLKGIPERVGTKNFIVRCEGLFSKTAFLKYRGEFDAARNAASGILNRQDVHRSLKDLSIVCLSVLEPNMKPSAGLAWLKTSGFKTVAWKTFPASKVTFELLQELLSKRLANGLFQIDGLVLAYDKVNRLPTNGNPDWSVAFKRNLSNDDAPVTTITNIVWKVSAHGYIIPKFEVAPVQMDGAVVRNATAKNPKLAISKGLGVGAKIGLVRSGDIIPEIVKVYTKAKFDLPSPSKFGPYHWDKTQTHIVLDNPKDSADFRLAKIARTFANLKIDGIRGKTVQRLIDAGYDNVSRILKASPEDFLSVEGFKETSANKLWNAIHEKTDQGFPLTQLMDASGVFARGMGQTRLDSVAASHSLMELAAMPKSDAMELIKTVPGFQETTAKMVVDGLPKFVKWLKITGLKIAQPKTVKIKLDSQKLTGLGVSFTGYRDKDQEAIVIKNGGTVVPFGGKTNILLVTIGGKASTKATTAEKKGIPVMLWDALVKKYKL